MTPITQPPECLIACRNLHLIVLCERMRPDEVEQYLALTGNAVFDPEVVAQGFIGMRGPKFALLDPDGAPAAAGGYEEVIPGVWQSWMVGTVEGWGAHWMSMTKACRWAMDNLLNTSARRLQTQALASRTRTIEWYERSLGLVREGTAKAFGANGEDVALFARVREN